MITSADVLVLYKLEDKTVLCYIHILLSQVPSANVLGMCKFQGIILSYTLFFIMYSGITKIYYTKTVGHIFTKPVQIKGKTQFFSHAVVYYRSSHFCR
jgi:hypothetical protein